MYYNTCPVCGAALDPGEKCEDCIQEEENRHERAKQLEKLTRIDNNGQYQFVLDMVC